ncbi:class I SAM-dependent methyltransferase [uncultured Rhodoblastus sp.]|uniref:class I SAM-dependent methyltransferase n=1 Tax=uncultured Rhodoblastus sp. TaxID=543037 RepID=UPI0025EDA13F|nr:class I SAM-dependent methyltransferase [uncultured Rhodoblastus sp.]
MDERENMLQSHYALTVGQFGPRAEAYVESAVHAGGADLDALGQLGAAAAPARALDLGTGGGHVAYCLARHAGRVTAVDLSPDMLRVVAQTARDKRLANIETVQAAAEDLPFADDAFDFLASRFSAHHWRDFAAGLRQARRVLRAGAPAVFIDIVSPGRAMLDTHLQAVELLRDPSHVRDYALDEWCCALARAGFGVRSCKTWRLRMDFAVWTERMRTPAPVAQAIRLLQTKADARTRAFFAVEADGSFCLDAAMVETAAV